MKNNLLLVTAFLLIFLLPAMGCSVETAHAPIEGEGAEETPTPAPTATFAPNTAVIFNRSGGIAGLDETWTVFLDGTVETNSTTQPQLSAEDVEQLLNSLESTGFFELEDRYMPEDTCCDHIFYQVTAVSGSQRHTVATLETTPDMPEALQQTLRLIQAALFESSNQ